MPFIEGVTLGVFFNDSKHTVKQKKKVLSKISKALLKMSKLPFRFAIGDLHEENVMVDQNLNIQFIDSDSWYIAPFCCTPAKYLEYAHFIPQRVWDKKYKRMESRVTPTLNTDIYCLLVYCLADI